MSWRRFPWWLVPIGLILWMNDYIWGHWWAASLALIYFAAFWAGRWVARRQRRALERQWDEEDRYR